MFWWGGGGGGGTSGRFARALASQAVPICDLVAET